MANVDVPIKRLMQSRISDWVEFLIPECEKDWIREMETSKVPARKESRLDKLVFIDSPKEKFILNIEPQGYLDRKMSARMLRYRADIWEYTIEMGIGTPSIKQAVIYFFNEHDNLTYHLKDSWEEEGTLNFSYKAIKIWQIKKSEVIKRKLEGLYPLLPLMEAEKDETKEEILQETIEKISTVQDEATKADFLAVMSILAGQKFSKEFVRKFVRREMLMQSELFNEWIKEEVEEREAKAEKKGAKEKVRKNIIELLGEKFDLVPKGIREALAAIEDEGILDGLLKKIIKVESPEEFKALLEKAKTM